MSRRCGTITAMELGSGDATYLSDLGPRLMAHFRQANVLLRPLGNTVYVMPPYCIEDADLDALYASIRKIADTFTR